MGLFHKKDSRSHDSRSDKASMRPGVTIDKLSEYSIRSPTLLNNSHTNGSRSKMVTTIPSNVDIPPAPDPAIKPAAYLRSIQSVRERSRLVLMRAKSNSLNHFDVDMSKFQETADYVVSIIKRDFAGDYVNIPPHGRWQHFEVGGRPRVTQLLQSWPTTVDNQERTRRLIDLFLVSVLLDAGAGTSWSYKSKESGRMYSRSEGLAVASLEMFKAGYFSSNKNQPHQVDALGLRNVSVETLAKGMQVSESNPMSGLEGRAGLLMRLSSCLQNAELFGVDARPGNMIGKDKHNSIDVAADQDHRLPHVTSYHSGVVGACRSSTYPLDGSDGRSLGYLASHSNQD
jgi:hypothetical protein